MAALLFIATLAALALPLDGRAQENLLSKPQVRESITTWLSFKDSNPTHQAEADSIAVLLGDMLAAWEPIRQVWDDRLRTRALELFYDNSRVGDEDGTNGYRMFMRRYLCFVALALLPGSEYAWFSAFIEDARDWVGDMALPEDRPELLIAIIDMVEALLLTNDGKEWHRTGTIKKLRKHIAILSNTDPSRGITERFVADYTALTNMIENVLEN